MADQTAVVTSTSFIVHVLIACCAELHGQALLSTCRDLCCSLCRRSAQSCVQSVQASFMLHVLLVAVEPHSNAVQVLGWPSCSRFVNVLYYWALAFKGFFLFISALHMLLWLGELFKNSHMSHAWLRLRNCCAMHRAGVCPPGLWSMRHCWENYQNKAGFSNTVDYIYRMLLQPYLGGGHSDLLFLPNAVGSL